jgi:hypothetical protein
MISESHATINRAISDFIWTKAPTREIDLAICWLRGIADDCSYKISRLERLKADRERARAYKRTKADIAAMFDDPDFLKIDPENQIRIIQQRLGHQYSYNYALGIRETVIRNLKSCTREDRDVRIRRMKKSGISPQKIAAKEGLTRQQVHNIVKKGEKDLF